MKSLLLETPLPASARKIGYSDSVLMHGSCFTTHIGERLQNARFRVMLNPFGTVFNPIAQCEQLLRALQNTPYHAEELIQRDDWWYSWMHHSQFHASHADALLDQLNRNLCETAQFLREASVVVLTLGTARSYIHRGHQKIVANCHKQPAALFEAGFSTPEQIASALLRLRDTLAALNPGLKIMYTVSPVRYHSNDPLENSVGKGNLFAALQTLRSQSESFWYFPAYEIITDTLRDYRFFADDLKHPSEKAIDIVWQQFKHWALQPAEAISIAEQLHQRKSHRPLSPQSKAHQQFELETEALERRLEALIKSSS